ncbi:daunorubicin ABC transporter ATP-binding protein [Salinigranum rubrum]|uniref:Daunorubicin ABC transporter ATP-binding protein n=1 Tax=Salinigranum rubrum TaxID=755307 RepID=A0A2I8VKE0_9EURY|nr:sodium-dependent transporter [Salinigranum rubrum]AUV82400.1 daunorubicin ABC transporter ATP-binding protein [Salinigranum rubrum]
MTRETWATRVGFILAAVGSAVGLGNIWRFPWVTAENGGSAFLLVYLLVVLAVGVPGLVGEFVIGRRAKRNPVGALRDLSGSRGWAVVGGLSVLTALVLLSFYSVVGGWILRYFVESLLALAGGPLPYATEPGAYFGAASTGVDALAYHLVFLGLTAVVVLGGVRKGIELGTTVMMPLVFLLLVALTAWAATQPDAAAGYAFYLSFDLSTLERNFLSILGPAAGQALFTLSLGAGTMITYASYLGEDRSLPFDAGAIAVLNTLVGVLAGLVVFPLLFSLGVDPGSPGPGALFVSIAGAFARLPVGTLVASAFFGVVALAALSSSISMLEIPVSFLVDEFGLDRRRAVAVALAVFAVTGAANALDSAVFQLFAVTLVDRLLTAGLAAFLLFVGWVLGKDALEEFRRGAGDFASSLGPAWLFAVGVVLPLFLVFTLLTSLGLDTHVGFWPTVAAAVAVGLAAFFGLRSSNSVV